MQSGGNQTMHIFQTQVTSLQGSGRKTGNCEEELPKKPVGRLSVNCRPSVDRQVTDSLPTVNQQVTDRLRKKENCGKHEQLTWCNIP